MYFRKVLVGTVLVVGGLGAQSGPSYPNAFPRPGSTKLFENDRVAVWEQLWRIGVPMPIHEHTYNMTGVYLTYGEIRVTTPDGRATVSKLFETPSTFYQAKGVIHKEEATGKPGDPERHAIMVNLKEFTPPPFQVPEGMPSSFPREGAKDIRDNPLVRIWDYTWVPKRVVPLHIHNTDTVEVFVEPGTLLTKTSDGKEETKTFAWKDVRWVPRGTIDSEEATAGSPRAFVIELK